MKQQPGLDDLALFVLVAQSGGLGAAARHSGLSVPTLSRKMQSVEQQLGLDLFQRGPRGYALTRQGQEALAHLSGLSGLQDRLLRDLSRTEAVKVRITAGTWMSSLLARRLTPEIIGSQWRPEFLEATARLDIARREADIGLRNAAPDQAWLAGRRIFQVEMAPFATSEAVQGFVGLSDSTLQTPSARWLRATHPDQIVATAGSPHLLADMALAGLGRVILPCFIAQDWRGLRQVGPVIDELTHDSWLVSHHAARHDPPVRAALDAISTLLSVKGLQVQ